MELTVERVKGRWWGEVTEELLLAGGETLMMEGLMNWTKSILQISEYAMRS